MKQSTTRFFQKHITQIRDFFIFKLQAQSPWEKISLWALVICTISLFIPWIQFISRWDTELSPTISMSNSFSWVIGNSGFFIALGICIGLFFIFSTNNKEKIHSIIPVSRKVHNVIFCLSLYIITLCLHTIFMIIGLQTFAANVVYGKWVILCLTWSFILLFGALQIKKDIVKNKKGTYINDSSWWNIMESSDETDEKKNNMKLPF